jgi:hypothetical protein
MVEMSRILPILVQFGGGALLCWVGVHAGIKSGYLDLKLAQDRRALAIVVGGYLALLVLYIAFTFWLPFMTIEVDT